ncbi:MAG: hypothetical protein BWY83_02679 [bacterium ADurb.Bin478]|nr:MAG: hypothetical protein BWY83_02679 [bacterium ADurb.Bin478]
MGQILRAGEFKTERQRAIGFIGHDIALFIATDRCVEQMFILLRSQNLFLIPGLQIRGPEAGDAVRVHHPAEIGELEGEHMQRGILRPGAGKGMATAEPGHLFAGAQIVNIEIGVAALGPVAAGTIVRHHQQAGLKQNRRVLHGGSAGLRKGKRQFRQNRPRRRVCSLCRDDGQPGHCACDHQPLISECGDGETSRDFLTWTGRVPARSHRASCAYGEFTIRRSYMQAKSKKDELGSRGWGVIEQKTKNKNLCRPRYG